MSVCVSIVQSETFELNDIKTRSFEFWARHFKFGVLIDTEEY